MESLLVVIKDDADGSDEQRVRAAIDALRAQADVQVARLAMPGDLDGALHRRGGRTVVVIGDDDHLHTVVSALHRRNELDETLVALLPDGSSKDFATGVGIPPDPVEAAHALLHGTERRFDLLIDCRGSVAVNAVQLERRRARTGDDLETAQAGRRSLLPDLARPLHVRVQADDHVLVDFDRPVLQVTVANVLPPRRSASPPAADPADGYADVLVCFAPSLLVRARRLLGRETDAHDRPVKVRARRVSVAGQRFSMRTDGVASGSERRCTWQVAPGRLRMLVPKS
ncbi:diacylglycerol/lipid kinase family protein [Thermasporomyces composti]|uniref:diacylglycerol/lipid kinase family protein n=1 Tax=Thermasporomyces composti TaxID=696763 RepID=UPI0014733959|nr:diacylglycerol kinase family protein [Thermasporomyces composti]